MENKEWAKLQETLLSEQLKVIRRFLREKDGERPIKARGMSKISFVRVGPNTFGLKDKE